MEASKIGLMNKTRLDHLMTVRGLAESRSQAQRLIMAGQVRVDGEVMLKPSCSLPEEAEITVDQPPRFVSRGGEKLEAAMLAFGLEDMSGWVCADVGASTGGFTDCLLQHGAEKVYAVDVGYGILHWKLRNDKRVVVIERTNARTIEMLPEAVDLVTIDASFISLRYLLPVVKNWLNDSKGIIIALIKPQFEAGRQESARGEGVIRNPAVHRRILTEIIAFAGQEGYAPQGLIRSPLQGPKGNIEFLAMFRRDGGAMFDSVEQIERVLPGE
ncbi:MAG: TlyA family RNA methyltransferase [Anaerolineaceae bacterium]|nr:TlyA family RNA methyltransferase [Anaerolineaceae bacterium]